jgi:signal transduction histidine kinase
VLRSGESSLLGSTGILGPLSLRQRFLLVLLPIVVAGPIAVGLVAEWSASHVEEKGGRRLLDAELERATLSVEMRMSHLELSAEAFANHWGAVDSDVAAGREGFKSNDEHWIRESQLLLTQWPELTEVFLLRDSSAGRIYSQVRREWSRDTVLRSGMGPEWVWGSEESRQDPTQFHSASFEGRHWIWWSRATEDDARLGILIDPQAIAISCGHVDFESPHWFALLRPDGTILRTLAVDDGSRISTDTRRELRAMDWSGSPQAWRFGLGAEDWVARSHFVASLNLSAVLAMSARGLAAGNQHGSIAMMIVTILAALLGSLIIAHLVGRVTRPLDRLGTAMQCVASGDLHPRIPVRGSDEMVDLARSFNSMVTDLHTTQEAMTLQRRALGEALREAESVERMKDDFLALVSHEVRTPLTTILGGIEFLLEGFREQASSTEFEFMTMVQESAIRLGEFMNDAILMANLQSKGGDEGFEEFSLSALVDMEFERIRDHIDRLDLDFDPRLQQLNEVFLEGDWTLFQVVIQKLLDNAWRHNRAGGRVVVDFVDSIPEDAVGDDLAKIMLAQGRRLRRKNHRWRALRVMNSGECLDPADIPGLFRRFELSHDIDHHQRGSGLSLPIVASIIEYHGGLVEARSIPDQGMAFYVVISTREAEAPRQQVPTLNDGVDDVVRMARQLAGVSDDVAAPTSMQSTRRR